MRRLLANLFLWLLQRWNIHPVLVRSGSQLMYNGKLYTIVIYYEDNQPNKVGELNIKAYHVSHEHK